MNNLPNKAKALVIAVILRCAALSGYAVMQGIPSVDAKFAVLLAMAVISARMKVKLPGIDSNMSMNLPFILVGVVQLTMPRAIVVGVFSTFVQCLPSSGQEMKLTQAAFNVCNMGNAIGLSFFFTSAAAKTAVARKSRPCSLLQPPRSSWLTPFRLLPSSRQWKATAWRSCGATWPCLPSHTSC